MSKSSNHISVGNKGENIVSDYLLKEGYQILKRNYRFKRAEIDIIALEENLLVFVEVKTRRYSKFGLPEESVNSRKSSTVKLAAENYISEISWENDIRFDIVSVTLGDSIQIEHIKDAFC